MPPKASKELKRDWSKYTHVPPSKAEVAKNGREAGRNLITWNRPQMAEKLLLHMEYELIRHRVNVPWDNIAHRLNPGSSGAAVSQYLGRLRKTILAQGHMVPPIPMKPGGPAQDPAIRGYVRSHESERDPTRTRNVLWTEPMVDLKTPLGDSAWALEIMNAEEDTDDGEDEIDLQPRKFSKAGPIGKRVETQNPRPSRGVANNVSYLDADYDEDEADGIDDEDFRELEDGFDGQACRSNRAGSKARAYARGSLASKRAQQNTGGVDTILGTVTPKRGAANNGGNLEDILNTAVLRTPDGKQYGFTNLGGVSNSFFTAASSPADFDFQNATPTTAANMIAHLGEWNPGFIVSPTTFGHINSNAILHNAGTSEHDMPVGTADTKMAEQWSADADVPDVFNDPKEFEAQMANKGK